MVKAEGDYNTQLLKKIDEEKNKLKIEFQEKIAKCEKSLEKKESEIVTVSNTKSGKVEIPK